MRILIVDTDYESYLHRVYAEHPGLALRSYEEQHAVQRQVGFGVSDGYVRALRALGHDARDVHVNNGPLLRAWAVETGQPRHVWDHLTGLAARAGVYRSAPDSRRFADRLRRRVDHTIFDRMRRRNHNARFLEMVRDFCPDVLLVMCVEELEADVLESAKNFVGVIVGQHAAMPLSPSLDLRSYDLFVSSFPPTVSALELRGLRAVRLRLGFDATLWERLVRREKRHDLSFVGGLEGVHRVRVPLLERLALEFPAGLRIWGPSLGFLPSSSLLHRHYQGPAWGIEAMQVLADSKVTLNHHGDIPPYANNLRLYEATGCGVALVTDDKVDLGEIFEKGKEVAVYSNADECVAAVRDLLHDESRRSAMAAAGQRRTLQDHHLGVRMMELMEILRQHAPRVS